jgi:hypothetical protein
MIDLSALPPYPSPNGFNTWATPYILDMSAYAGETVDIAWHATDGDGNGLWYPWAIDDCTVGITDLMSVIRKEDTKGDYKNDSPEALIGYQIFRRQGFTGEFVQLNTIPVTDTTYQDFIAEADNYYYYIKSVFAECENPVNSDTVLAEIITRVSAREKHGVDVFPNPADNQIIIRSAEQLYSFTLFTLTGVIVGEWKATDVQPWIIPTATITPGVYLGKIRLDEESISVMIVITHH